MRGLVNIYTPLATLIHHESKSRGLDFAPEHLERYMRELAVFQERWGAAEVEYACPCGNPRIFEKRCARASAAAHFSKMRRKTSG